MQTVEERLITQWVEPDEQSAPGMNPLFLYGGGLLFAALLVLVGIWQKEANYYLAAGVISTALLAFRTQHRHDTPNLEVFITNVRVVIGKHEHALEDLAGFWLQTDATDTLIITFEHKKPAILPASCRTAASEQQTRAELTQVLPELEPRTTHFSEQLNQYLHF